MPSVRPKRYICAEPGCGKAYNRPVLLRQHERTHNNERPFHCTVNGCNKSFFRKSHLDVHELFHKKDSEKPHICPICGKGTISPHLLRRHELTHTKKYKCTYDGCTEAYYRFQSLKHHVDTVHKQVLLCKTCNRRFQSPALLHNHKLKAHGEATSFQCEETGCFTVFKDERSLKKHIREDHPVFKCPQCDVSVTGSNALDLHMRTHQESVTVDLWKCKTCKETSHFVRKAELIKHYHDIHHGDLPEDIIGGHNEVELLKFIEQTKSTSLQSMNRYKHNFRLDSESSGSEEQQNAIETEVPQKSIIDLVSENSQKMYVCPKKHCGRKFTRLHAYEKHLKGHEVHLEQIEEFLRKIEMEEHDESPNGKPSDEEVVSDHFTDMDSDFE